MNSTMPQNAMKIAFECLIHWIEQNEGYVNPKIDMRIDSIYGREIYAQERILQGETIIVIPDKICINKEKIKKFPLHDQIIYKPQDQDFNRDLSILVLLLEEVEKGKTSFFYPYIQLLPSFEDFEMHPLRLFSEEKNKEWIKISSRTTSFIQKRHYKFLELVNYISLFQKKTDYFDAQSLDYSHLLWLYLCICTRQWDLAGLVPLADLLQHHNHSQIVLSQEYWGIRSTMKTSENIEKGNSVYDNYQIYDTAVQYSCYGFIDKIEEASHHRYIDLAINDLIDESSIQDEKITWELEKYRVSYMPFLAFSNTQIEKDVLHYGRILALNESDLKKVNIYTPYFEKEISKDNQQRCKGFFENCLQKLQPSPESLHYAEEIIKTADFRSPEYHLAKINLIDAEIISSTQKNIGIYFSK